MNLKQSGKSKARTGADAREWVLRRKGGGQMQQVQMKRPGNIREGIGYVLLLVVWCLFIFVHVIQKVFGRRKGPIMISLSQVAEKMMRHAK